jgi:hypothetical protein
MSGITTKSGIKEFCPRANVGVLVVEGVDQEKDIRWVTVPHNGDLWDSVLHDGDWIVEKSPGHWFVLSDVDFHREYVML